MRDAAGMLRRGPSGKTSDREIRRAPKKMDRTAFPAEPRSKFLKHAVDLDENAPKSVRIFRIIRAMLLILIERNRIRDLVRQGVDLDRQFQIVQRGHDRF